MMGCLSRLCAKIAKYKTKFHHQIIEQIDDKTRLAYTPAFHYAVEKNHWDIIQCLIKYIGAKDIDIALINAVKNNDKKVIDLFMKREADVNTVDKNNKSSLIYAVCAGNTEVVKLLIAKGADVNVIDNDGKSALIYAFERNNIKIAKILLKKKADINITDVNKTGLTPLIYAAEKKLSAETVDLIIGKTKQECLNFEDKNGCKAVDYLIANDYKDELIKKWMRKARVTRKEKAEIRQKLKNRNLYNAVSNSDFDDIKKLIKEGADVNYKRYNDTPIIALPLKVVADPNIAPESIKSLIEMLLDNGAKYDPSINYLWRESPPIIQELLQKKWGRSIPKSNMYAQQNKEKNIYDRDVWANDPYPSLGGYRGYKNPYLHTSGSYNTGDQFKEMEDSDD